jgi:hypothetical protein
MRNLREAVHIAFGIGVKALQLYTRRRSRR